MKLQKGYRKIFFGIVSFIWAIIVTIIVILLINNLFPKSPEIITPTIGVILGFGSSIVLYLFASNSMEHKYEGEGKNIDNNKSL